VGKLGVQGKKVGTGVAFVGDSLTIKQSNGPRGALQLDNLDSRGANTDTGGSHHDAFR
jgi:hypothetical protein